MSRTVRSLLAILAILAVGLPLHRWIVRASAPPPAVLPPELGPVPVRVARLVPCDLALEVRASGTLAPAREVALALELGGRLARVHPGWRRGAAVEAGEELLALDPRPLELALAGAEAALDEARAAGSLAAVHRGSATLELENAEERLVIAERDEARVAGLGASGAASESALDRARSERLAAEAAVGRGRSALDAAVEEERAAAAALARAEVAREQAADRLRRARLVAPFDGRLVGRAPEVGALVAAGEPLGALVDVSRLVLEAAVAEDELRLLRPGLPARVVVPARAEEDAGPPLEGAVVAIAPRVDPRTRSGVVEIEVANDGALRLPAGAFAEARVRARTLSDALHVRREHLRWRDGVPTAFVLAGPPAAGRADARALVLGREVGEGFVVAAGLAPGELLILGPLDPLEDGTPCRALAPLADGDGGGGVDGEGGERPAGAAAGPVEASAGADAEGSR